MLHSEKRMSWFLKLGALFIAWLFVGSTLHAQNNHDMLNNGVTIEKVSCTETDCFFPGKEIGEKNIHVIGRIDWDRNENLVLHTKGDIIFEKDAKIVVKGNSSIVLKSGIEPGDKDIYDNKVEFKENIPQIEMQGTGKVKIYYNPTKGDEEYKYHNPASYSNSVSPRDRLETYMLINDIYDLQDITSCLYGSYALSQDIDASPTKNKDWGEGKGFFPIKDMKTGFPFSGVFDGNYCTIKNLYINRPKENDVGLFGYVSGSNNYRSVIKNFSVKKAYINGNRCVGTVIGEAKGVLISGISVVDSKIYGEEDSGLGAGCVLVNEHNDLRVNNATVYENGKKK
jgi:hypothetical protein